MAEKRKRFEKFSEEELRIKHRNTIPKATQKNNVKWDRVMKQYLQEIGCTSLDYWAYPDNDFDQILSHFWFEVRTQQRPLNEEEMQHARDNGLDLHPEMYTIASLRNLRNGISRCMEDYGRPIDLTNDPRYEKSPKSFRDACKELKDMGKGKVKNYKEIEHAGTL